MRLIAIFIFLILFVKINAFGQTRLITGKIITSDFYPNYQANIYDTDSTLLVTADANGDFKINIPIGTKSLIVRAVMMEQKHIVVPINCNHLEIIMITSGSYDYMPAHKIDLLRKKEFKKLPRLFLDAFNKGIFKSNKPCYDDIFIPLNKNLKEIHKNRPKKPSS